MTLLWIVLVLLGSAPQCRPSEHLRWKEFRSEKLRFTAMYPSSWHLLYAGDTRLDIINFPDRERQPGIVISATGAWIIVRRIPRRAGLTMDMLVRTSLQGSSATSDREIDVPNAPANGCRALREVTWREKAYGVLGKSDYSDTAYYCSIGKKLFSVFLTNWDGDPKQAELRATALEIAKSLRTQ